MENYNFIRQLGKGAFGSVSLMQRLSDGELVALKTIEIPNYSNLKRKNKKKMIKINTNEIEKLKKASSSPICFLYISCYYDSFIDKKNGIVYLEMEYISGLTAIQYINEILTSKETYEKKKELINESVYNIIIGISLALFHIHKLEIIHADVKPSNIVIENKTGIPKLVDFGLSCLMESKETKECQNIAPCCQPLGNTWQFVAPEFASDPYKVLFPKSDVFSLGSTIYNLLTGEFIWNIKGKTFEEKRKEILLESSINQKKIETGNEKIDYLVNRMIDYNIFTRINIDEIILFLKNDFSNK